ncbi:MAG TPA: hypothetical protein VIV06_00415, partial [Candidatus Limnocylindrales bacterium]
ALLAVVAAQWLDFATFVAMVRERGVGSEANPVVGAALAMGGMPLVTLGKFALMLLLVSTVVILGGERRAARYPRLARTIVIASVLAGIVGGVSNVATIAG